MMTDKETLFISEYLIDFNGTQAAIRAKYSQKTARQIASELLSKPYIQVAIKKYIDSVLDNNKLTLKVEIIQELRTIAFLRGEEVNETAKLRALELLGKYMIMFTDKKEIEHSTVDENGEKAGFIFVDPKEVKDA